MKVCHLITHDPETAGGIETVAQQLGKGYDIKWLGIGGARSLISGISMAIKLRFSDYDVIHVHDNAGYWCTMLTRNKKIIYTSHVIARDYFDLMHPTNVFQRIKLTFLVRMQERLIKNSDVVVPITEDIRKRIKNIYGVKPYDVVHNGVDADEFRPLRLKKKYDYIWSGTNPALKRLDYAIDIARHQKKSIAVAGLYGTNNDNVTYLGRVERRKMPETLNLARTLIYFSKHKEYSLTILEAMACGLNIMTNTHLLKEIASRPKKISEDLSYLDGRTGRKIAVDNFSWDKARKKYKKVYEDVVKNANTKK